MSFATCHVSHVTYHMSHVTCHMLHDTKPQSGEASQLRVCYQRGLHRLVYFPPEVPRIYIKHRMPVVRKRFSSTKVVQVSRRSSGQQKKFKVAEKAETIQVKHIFI